MNTYKIKTARVVQAVTAESPGKAITLFRQRTGAFASDIISISSVRPEDAKKDALYRISYRITDRPEQTGTFKTRAVNKYEAFEAMLAALKIDKSRYKSILRVTEMEDITEEPETAIPAQDYEQVGTVTGHGVAWTKLIFPIPIGTQLYIKKELKAPAPETKRRYTFRVTDAFWPQDSCLVTATATNLQAAREIVQRMSPPENQENIIFVRTEREKSE